MTTITPEKFLKELKAFDKEKYAIVTTLRDLVLTNKSTSEEIKYGGLLYSLEKPYTGIFVYKNHVTLEFSEGAKLNDPDKLLNGSGRHRRNLQFKTVNEINKSVVRDFLKQARGL
jgi:hypothetical protein